MTDAIAQSYLKQPPGWKGWLFTLDHKRIGILYLVGTLTFMVFGGFLAMLIRFELLHPARDIMGPETYNRVFTLHGAIMIFLFLIPSTPAALGNFILPQMIGARDVAFPRLNLTSWYIYVFGSLFTLYSIAHGGVDTGWSFYTPYSTQTTGAVIPMILGIFIIGFSSILTGLNFIVTVHKLRAPGMTWFKMPLFVWSLYATAIIQVLATPVLAITLILLILERVLGIGIFDPAMGGDPVLYQHFFWFYSHPAVYIMILPGMGIISELIPVFSHKKIFGYNAIAYSSLAIALIGFLVWGHHMFTSGQSELAATIFSFLTFMVAIPSGVKIFNWLATMYKGQISLKTPMLYALSFMFLFTIGGLAGMFLGALAVDVHLHGTYFVIAHFHYVMMGGALMALLGGLHYWWPKMFGRMYSERWGQVSAVLVFIGFHLTFFTQFIMGTKGMPRRYYSYPPQYQTLHDISTVGSWILALGAIIMITYLIHSLFRGRPAPANPWGGLTLEWTVASPTPPGNFPRTPHLTHGPYDYDTVLVKREADGAGT
jgi:cytochrome c oxidase subunit 1